MCHASTTGFWDLDEAPRQGLHTIHAPKGIFPWGHETLAATLAAGVLYISVILITGEQRIYSSYVSFEVALKTGSPSVAVPTAIVIVQANTIP